MLKMPSLLSILPSAWQMLRHRILEGRFVFCELSLDTKGD